MTKQTKLMTVDKNKMLDGNINFTVGTRQKVILQIRPDGTIWWRKNIRLVKVQTDTDLGLALKYWFLKALGHDYTELIKRIREDS